jgi:hypothetical protein
MQMTIKTYFGMLRKAMAERTYTGFIRPGFPRPKSVSQKTLWKRRRRSR